MAEGKENSRRGEKKLGKQPQAWFQDKREAAAQSASVFPRSRQHAVQEDDSKHLGAFQTGVRQNLHAPSHAGAVEMPAGGATVTSSEVGINPQRLLSEVFMNITAALDSLDNNGANEFCFLIQI